METTPKSPWLWVGRTVKLERNPLKNTPRNKTLDHNLLIIITLITIDQSISSNVNCRKFAYRRGFNARNFSIYYERVLGIFGLYVVFLLGNYVNRLDVKRSDVGVARHQI